MNASSATSRAPSLLDWRTSLPLVLLASLVGCTAIFIHLTQQFEANRLADQQAADMLWVEQTLRFQLTRDEESVQLVAADLDAKGLSTAALNARLEQLERSRHEFQRLAFLELDPLDGGGVGVAGAGGPVGRAAFAALVRGAGRPAYSQPYAASPGTVKAPMLIDYVVPTRNGAIVAVLSLDRILSDLVPWWFAQKNEMQLLDGTGAVLASRAAAGKGKGVYTHTTLLDASGASLYLHADSIEARPSVFTNVLAGIVLLLSLALIGTLYALRRDMRHRAAAEQQLRVEHAFRKAMDDSLETGIRARDLSGRLTYVNPAFCRMVGYERDRLVGCSPPMPYWIPDAVEEHSHALRRTLSGESPTGGYETLFQRADGSRVQVLIHEARLIDANGVHTGWLSSVVDVTERRHIEEINRIQQERLLSGSRLATLGEIASTLSHELNQPLAAINGYATGCLNLMRVDPRRRDDAHGEDLVHAIETIHAQAARAGRILKSVHDLVRKRDPKRERCDLRRLVRAVLPMIELQARNRRIAIEAVLGERPLEVWADAVMIEQVILNLGRNAIEATQAAPAGRRVVEIAATPTGTADGEAPGVRVDVVDNGAGVPPGRVKELFTPFFTTKAEGMGMGLSICRSTIEYHSGRIAYAPHAGGGSVFTFWLPAMPDDVASVEPVAVEAAA